MEGRTYTIVCRLDEVEFRKLKDEADAIGLNTSDYIRMITRLPIERKRADDPDSFIVIEP